MIDPTPDHADEAPSDSDGDVTQRKLAEQVRESAEALRASEERLRLVVENATEYAIFSMDLQRRITIWNSGAQRLLGYSGSEIVGQSADVIFTEEDRAAGAPEQEMKAALRDGRAEHDRRHRRKGGSRFWAGGVMMVMRDADGQVVGFLKILRDQTQAREHRDALERSRQELEAADAAKDQFLAVLSHELRNPLASIDSAASLLLTPQLPQHDRGAASEVVKRQAGAMKALLDDLLDVSRLKLGRLVLHLESVALDQVVASALETVRPLLESAGHEFKLDLPSHPVELDVDPLRLSQVLTNLLTNAAKYTPPGGKIRLKARLESGHVLISVTDSGIGIEPGEADRLFAMYAQAQPLPDRSHGLGIGLALARSIVELHGGKVAAFSGGLGRGSEFRVVLPVLRGAAPAPTPVPAAIPAAIASKPNKRGLVIIADDNADAGWGIARLLEIAGFETRRVRGGVEAVKQIRKDKPDAGIIDVGMPDMSGHEVARQVRQTEWGRHMVLIAATGWGHESDQRDAIAAGFDAHMTKPVDLRKLSALVDELLAAKRR